MVQLFHQIDEFLVSNGGGYEEQLKVLRSANKELGGDAVELATRIAMTWRLPRTDFKQDILLGEVWPDAASMICRFPHTKVQWGLPEEKLCVPYEGT